MRLKSMVPAGVGDLKRGQWWWHQVLMDGHETRGDKGGSRGTILSYSVSGEQQPWETAN